MPRGLGARDSRKIHSFGTCHAGRCDSRNCFKFSAATSARATTQATTISEEVPPLPPLARALREFLIDVRPAENLLVLKTPPSGAQPLAAAVDASKFPEIAGTIAGDDTVLIITASRKTRAALQQKIEALLK